MTEPEPYKCTDCNDNHAEKAVCGCGRCMYSSCKQIEDVFTEEDDVPADMLGEPVVTM